MKKKFRNNQNWNSSENPSLFPRGETGESKLKPDLLFSRHSDWKRKHRRVCTEVNKLGGAALAARGLRLRQEASGKPLERPLQDSSPSAHSVPTRRTSPPRPKTRADSLTSTKRQFPGTKWIESSFSRPTMPAVLAPPPPQRPPLPPAQDRRGPQL